MDALAAFCSECSTLAVHQLDSPDGTVRLCSLCAMFVGMKDNVVLVQQGVANNTCSVTNRMTQWMTETVREARALIKALNEEPRPLNFFERRFISFCVTLDNNDELNELLDARLHQILCRAFLIQIAIYCEEPPPVVDVLRGSTPQSVQQEFLGCVFDLKQRIASSLEHSEQTYKRLVFQISEEYQNRQDERTVAGKRAFIHWHKATNDMIKLQLQQRLSERERTIQLKNDDLQLATAKLERIKKEHAATDAAASLQSSTQASAELEAARRQNSELGKQLETKSKLEADLKTQRATIVALEHQLKEKDNMNAKTREDTETERKDKAALAAQIAALQASAMTHEKDMGALIEGVGTANERAKTAEKQSEQQAAEIEKLKGQLKETEAAPAQNGINEEVLVLRQQLSDTEAKQKELNAAVITHKKENGTLREQIRAKQNENVTITQSVSRKVEEVELLKTEIKKKDKNMKNYEQEIKSLREQVKELQAKHVELLESNVEIEETSKALQEQISQKEQEIMEVENKFLDLEEQMKRDITDKTEKIESLERTVKRLNTSLENTKRDLQSKKAELEELQGA